MSKEFERKFVLKEWPEAIHFSKRISIRQGYLAIDGHNEVRIREAGHVYMFTVKSLEMQGREEVDITIDRNRFHQLWSMTDHRRIRKVRHIANVEAHTIELDEFLDQHEGLRIVEVEFPDESAAAAFEPYEWLGKEVTHDPAFKNRNLALSLESPAV